MYHRTLVHLAGTEWSFGVVAFALGHHVRDPQPIPVISRDPADPVALAAEYLRRSDHFTSASVGYAGITPTEVFAWQVIYRSPGADSVFKTLYRTGSVATQLYALAGLYFTDSVYYRRNAAALAHRGLEVRLTRGCSVMQEP